MGFMAEIVKKEIEFRLPLVIGANLELLVKPGDTLKKGQVIAKPKEPQEMSWDVRSELGGVGEDWMKYVLVEDGAIVAKDKLLARHGKKKPELEIVAPFMGRVSLNVEQGEMALNEVVAQGEVVSDHNAVLDGEEGNLEVVLPAWVVKLEYGWGPSASGVLKLAQDDVAIATIPWLNRSYQGTVLVVPYLTQHLWHKANALGVRAVVCGNLPSNYELWLDEVRDNASLLALFGDDQAWGGLLKLVAGVEGEMVYVLGNQGKLIIEKSRRGKR